MKIIFISPEIPWPLDTGGKIRSFNLIKNLAKKHSIILICFGSRKNFGPLDKICNQIHLVPFSLSLPIKIFNFFRSFFVVVPMKILNFQSLKMTQAINHILEKEKPEVLFFEHIYMAQYVEKIKKKPKQLLVWDTHNIYYRFFESLSKTKNKFKAFINRTQIGKMRDYEARIANQFDLIFVCSKEDQLALAKIASRVKIEILPNGVDVAAYRDLKKRGEEKIILFVGSFDHFPNEEGILWFTKKVFPKIKSEVKDAKLYLIGRQPPAAISALTRNPAIEVFGFVENIKPYLAEAKVFIVPLLSGGGTRLKILEAMAARIPVVSTKIGAEGLRVLDGKNIFLTDSEDDFAKKVADLILNEKLQGAIIKNAFNSVEEKYDWSKIVQTLERSIIAHR